MSDFASKFVAGSAVVECAIDGGIALLDIDRNVYFSLNKTGAVVWAALREPRSVEEISTLLSEKFHTTAEACRGDVARLVGRLVDVGLANAVATTAS
jgi:sensor domain CHASE-containing protein